MAGHGKKNGVDIKRVFRYGNEKWRALNERGCSASKTDLIYVTVTKKAREGPGFLLFSVTVTLIHRAW